MPYGPVELLVVGFPGNQFSGEITPALTELVDSGTIRVIDLLFAMKDADGSVLTVEVSEALDDASALLDPNLDDEEDLLTYEDALALTDALPVNTSVGIMLFENVWAKRFADAVVNANGQVLLNERIPRAVIESLIAEHVEPVS